MTGKPEVMAKDWRNPRITSGLPTNRSEQDLSYLLRDTLLVAANSFQRSTQALNNSSASGCWGKHCDPPKIVVRVLIADHLTSRSGSSKDPNNTAIASFDGEFHHSAAAAARRMCGSGSRRA